MENLMRAFLNRYRAAALVVAMVCLAFVSNAQVYQQYNQYGGKWKRFQIDSLAGIPKDTLTPTGGHENQPHLASIGDTLYIWSTNQFKWLPFGAGGGGIFGQQSTELIEGGEVSWLGDFDFFVNAALYRIDNVLYQSDTASFTLSGSDNDSARIDKFYLAIDAAAHVQEGDLAPPASVLEPQLSGDELGLAFVTISPGASAPNITTQKIYDENTESTVTNTGTTTDPANITFVYSGTVNLNVTNINDPAGAAVDEVLFTKNPVGSWPILGFDGVTGFILLKAVMPASAELRIQLFVGATAVSLEVIIPLNKSNITTHQPFTIPAASFGNITNTNVTAVRIRYTRASSTATYAGFYLDNMFFVDGVVQAPSAGNFTITMNVASPLLLSPANTIQNNGTWNLTWNGSAANVVLANGSVTPLPVEPTEVGIVQSRAHTTNHGGQFDQDTLFLDTVTTTGYGLATPTLFNRVMINYFLQNVGNGDSLAFPLNDSTTAIKSIFFTTVWGHTDSTILIDTTGGAGSRFGFLTEDDAAGENRNFNIGAFSLTLRDGVNPYAVFGSATVNLYGGPGGGGGTGTSQNMDATQVQILLDNGTAFGGFSLIKDGLIADGIVEADSLHFNFDQYQVSDTANWKPIVVNSSGAVATAFWSDLGGGGATPTLQEVLDAGSTLTSSETITLSTNILTLSGTATSAQFNAGTGALTLSNSNNAGLSVSTTYSGTGNFISRAASSDAFPVISTKNTTDGTNTSARVLSLGRATTGTPGNGLASELYFTLETAGTGAAEDILSNKVISRFSIVDHPTRTSEFDINGIDGGTEETFMNIQKDLVRINNNADTLAKLSDYELYKGFMTDVLVIQGAATIIPRYYWYDEFQGSSTNTAGSTNTFELVSGTGANATVTTNASSITGATGYGYAELTTGTTTTGKAVLSGGYGATNQNQMGQVNNDYYYRCEFKNVIINDLSDGTDTYKVFFGFQIDNTVSNAIYFTYTDGENSGVWNCTSHNNTTPQTTSTATTVAVDTEYDLAIEYYNQTAKFYLNWTLVATHTTQVPAAASIMYAPSAKILKSAGTTARIAYLDAIGLRINHENDL